MEHSKELEIGNELDEILKLVGSMRLAPSCVTIASIADSITLVEILKIKLATLNNLTAS